MRIGLIGLAQSGKKTLFGLLTGAQAAPHGRREHPIGVGRVPDGRVERLAAVYGSKRVRFAEIEWMLLPSPPSDERQRSEWLEAARKLDGLCCVLREFRDPAVYHEKGSVDPARDLGSLELELAVADLALVETRLERLAREKAKRTAAEREKERAVLERLRGELEAERPLGSVELSDADQARLSGLQFLTRKRRLVAVNVDESEAGDESRHRETAASLPAAAGEVVCVSAKIEAEIAEIEDPDERAAFMADLGIAEPGAARVSRAALEALDRITFFTANREEAHAWTLPRGATALEAAGAVHTDFARGFIRAERMSLDELESAGSEAKLRERGRLEVKGKDYAVEEGDVLHILANV
jgi:hypothetical protein